MSAWVTRTKTALITGAAGGLGRATVERLGAGGWRVFATDLPGPRLDALGGADELIPLAMDVAERASVEACRETVAAREGGLDAIVNFAGVLEVGAMIELEEATYARLLDVNLLGTFRVNQVFFPLVQARGGRIVNLSSETGWQSGAPFNGAYASSKHAIEAYTDSLRRELMFLGVPVIKIQPGPFRTEMVASIEARFAQLARTSEHFGALLETVGALTASEARKAHDPALVADAVWKALSTTRPRAAYSVKPDPTRSLLDRLPIAAADRVLHLALTRLRR